MGVYLRSNIWWVSYTTVEGKLVRRSADTPSKAEAELYEAQCRLKYGKRFEERKPALPFNELVERCISHWRSTTAAGTQGVYKERVKGLVRFFGDTPVDAIDIPALDRCRESLRDGRCNQTVNTTMSLAAQILNLALRWGFIEKNPALSMRALKVVPSRLRHLSRPEQTALLSYLAPNPLMHDLVLVALRTGMRRGELLGLKVCDVDLSRNQVALWQTKTNTPRHTPLLPGAAEALARNCAGKNSQDFVFTYRDGARAGRKLSHVHYNWRRAVIACGLGDFHFHDLRHTFASDLVMAGAAMTAVSELLGHSTVTMTKRYTHLSPDFRQGEMKKLQAYLDS